MRQIVKLSLVVFGGALGASLFGCVNNSYMGISLSATKDQSIPPQIRELAARARSGDRLSQLALGEMFEDGALISRNLRFACDLYQLAGSDRRRRRSIYSRTPGGPEQGILIMPARTSIEPGLTVARQKQAKLLSMADSADSCQDLK